jgi:hypothetical protein
MPPPPQKKPKTASADDLAIGFVPILVSSDNDKEGSTGSDTEDDDISISDESSDVDTGINDLKMVVLPNAHPSPPPTVQKRKRGRKPKSSKTVDEGGAAIGLIFYNYIELC